MDVIRLKPEWSALFSRIRALGPAISVTRNSGAAIVKASAYALPQFANKLLGQVVGSVDLRLFMENWGDAFAITSDQGQRARRCICIFDRYGNAAHKIMLHPESCTAAFDTLAWDLYSENQSTSTTIEPFPQQSFSSNVDADELRDAVRVMSLPFEFGMILRRFNVAREHALRLISTEYAYCIAKASIREMFKGMTLSGNALTCLIENPGMLHIHTSPIERITQSRRWLKILDPGFNFYLDEASVANVWILRRPTCNGFITSIEAYDLQGSLLVQFSGQRRSTDADEGHWQTLTASLPRAAHD